MSIEAMKLALEALTATMSTHGFAEYIEESKDLAITALRQAIEQAQKDHTYGYAKHLAETIFKLHFASDEHYASGQIVWGVNDTVIGILTQIDNMVADMVRKSEQAQKQEPVATMWQHGETGRTRITTPDSITDCDARWFKVSDLYTSPPQRLAAAGEDIRKPLTDEQRNWIVATCPTPRHIIDTVEKMHGIKGKA